MSLVRPVPAFIPPVVAVPAANAIVPFVPPVVSGAAAVGGLIAGAPPLVVIGGAVLAGALVGIALQQLWGWANSSRGIGTSVVDPPTEIPPATTAGLLYEAPAGYTVRIIDTRGFGHISFWGSTVSLWWQQEGWYDEANGVQAGYMWVATPSGSFQYRPLAGLMRLTGDMPPDPVEIAAVKAGEPDVALSPAVPQPNWFGEPLPLPPLLPQTLPEAEPLPERPRQVPPLTVPAIPGSRPAEPAPAGLPTPTTPRTQPPPATLPQAPVFPQPLPAGAPRPTGSPVRPDGSVAPAPEPPVTRTPPNVHVVNGTQIPANGPQATPQGIAQELGRIENKLARLIDPKSDRPGQQQDRLGWLRDNLGNITDFFLSTGGGGEYRISSPCVLDEEGQRIERVVEYEGSLQSLGVISNKIDALAALLQEHKDLKQPICRETPATGGQAVTVNFVQID